MAAATITIMVNTAAIDPRLKCSGLAPMREKRFIIREFCVL